MPAVFAQSIFATLQITEFGVKKYALNQERSKSDSYSFSKKNRIGLNFA